MTDPLFDQDDAATPLTPEEREGLIPSDNLDTTQSSTGRPNPRSVHSSWKVEKVRSPTLHFVLPSG